MELSEEFEKMADNPEADWSFLKEREESGFANFGVSPEKAQEIRDHYDREAIENAFQNGMTAQQSGLSPDDCPYTDEKLAESWIQGYRNLLDVCVDKIMEGLEVKDFE